MPLRVRFPLYHTTFPSSQKGFTSRIHLAGKFSTPIKVLLPALRGTFYSQLLVGRQWTKEGVAEELAQVAGSIWMVVLVRAVVKVKAVE